MNYFRAKKHQEHIEKFETLAMAYWNALPEQHHDAFCGKFEYEENDKSMLLRQEIVEILPYVEEAAQELGLGYSWLSYPAPAIGGPVIPVNVLDSVINPEMGHKILERKLIVDTIGRLKSVAIKTCKQQLVHMLLPWNWILDLCALIIRLPFIVLRRAGLPPQLEENIWAQVGKIVWAVMLMIYLFYKGIGLSEATISTILQSLSGK